MTRWVLWGFVCYSHVPCKEIIRCLLGLSIYILYILIGRLNLSKCVGSTCLIGYGCSIYGRFKQNTNIYSRHTARLVSWELISIIKRYTFLFASAKYIESRPEYTFQMWSMCVYAKHVLITGAPVNWVGSRWVLGVENSIFWNAEKVALEYMVVLNDILGFLTLYSLHTYIIL